MAATYPKPLPDGTVRNWPYPGAIAETVPRWACNQATAPTSGALRLASLVVPHSRQIHTITFLFNAGGTFSHLWFALLDQSFNVLATTVDEPSTVATHRVKTLALATAIGGSTAGGSYTPNSDQPMIVGCCAVYSSGTPTLAAAGGAMSAFEEAPLPNWNILSGLTGPSSLPANPLPTTLPSNTLPWAAVS